jgi:hypothetical protein
MLLNNNFNGGPDGTAITTGNTGQFGDDAFNVINPAGAGGAFAFADCGVNNLPRPTAQYALKVATGGGAIQQPYAAWTTSMGTQTNVYARFYLWFSSVGATTHDQDLLQLYVPGVLVNVSVYLLSTASPIVLGLINYASATTKASVTPVAGQWNRVEFFANVNGASSTGTLRLYAGDDVDTDNITDTATQTAANYGSASTSGIALGQLGGTTDAFPPIYVSNWQVNNTGWPGPAPFRQGLGTPSGNLTNPVAIHMN